MDKNTFRYLWEEGIVKATNSVYDDVITLYGNKYDIHVDLSDMMFDKVYDQYEAIRKKVRSSFFWGGDNDKNKMDAHKICACITGALLDNRIITFPLENDNLPVKIVLANYEVAFLSSLYILYLFILSEYKNKDMIKCYEALERRAAFVLPETNQGHDTYMVGRVKSLALNANYGNAFDVLSYADMLYWIDLYNRQFIQREIDANDVE